MKTVIIGYIVTSLVTNPVVNMREIKCELSYFHQPVADETIAPRVLLQVNLVIMADCDPIKTNE